MSSRMTATITRIEPLRHFAIATDDFGDTYMVIPRNFAQFSSIRFEDLAYGDIIEFTPIDGPRGKRAIEIKG